MEMVTIKSLSSFMIGGYTIQAQHNIRQYYELSNVFVAREEEENGNGHLFAYGYYKDEYKLKWKFPFDNVVGIHPIIPELKKEEEFITPEHYKNYIEKFRGKELLEVYAGNLRFVLNADTGEIYDKMETR
ncbi:hypothetical protein [Flavobacterium psychrophilum]|uniref:hypothetical protein n=2 Tax=Flavobacterium psychrophilum TaxID=96345 RepID=UPI000B7C0C0B|nr:hypothetical protein [Flavobacterium psychrophilum]EKT3958616.1 hypothetical protein [Flavobacterium psychrophilum]EKT4499163.1 hypothetical protein [Flavobacterium psychrophilum]EKT4510927.1 hypothetical protein [Flavobacterium psychrophilum]ELM3650822.1 hypothetical protein [Flavobacterium psychrophilum]ELM3671476.1 hypothetical protein [Flavobacterium psychrophilum]